MIVNITNSILKIPTIKPLFSDGQAAIFCVSLRPSWANISPFSVGKWKYKKARCQKEENKLSYNLSLQSVLLMTTVLQHHPMLKEVMMMILVDKQLLDTKSTLCHLHHPEYQLNFPSQHNDAKNNAESKNSACNKQCHFLKTLHFIVESHKMFL